MASVRVPRLSAPINLASETFAADYPLQFPTGGQTAASFFRSDGPSFTGSPCGRISLSAKTLPGGSASEYFSGRPVDPSFAFTDAAGRKTVWPRRVEIAGPASIGKNIYGVFEKKVPGERAKFPPLKRYVPEGTLYAHQEQLRQYDDSGKLVSAGFLAYPFHHRFVREVETYVPRKDRKGIVILPYPSMLRWGKAPAPVGDGKWGGWGEVAN